MRMERSSSSVIRLPPGFRFHPTDEELVSQYLKRKVLSYPVPAGIIPEIDFLRHNPADLPGNYISHLPYNRFVGLLYFTIAQIIMTQKQIHVSFY